MLKIFLVCQLVLSGFASGGGDESLAELVDKLTSRNRDARIAAVLEIGRRIPELNDEQQLETAFNALIDSVADPADLVNSAAKFRLAELQTQTLPYLKPYFESTEFRSYAKAVESIKAIGPPAKVYLAQLEKHVDSGERNFQLAALHGLGVLDGKDLLPVLDKTIAALDSEDFNIQLSACRVLSRMGPTAKKAGPRLVKLLEEGIASSRSWASIALGAIGPHEDYDVVELLAERLDRFYLVDRQRALIGLAFLGPAAKTALPKVEALMKDRSKSVQHTAAQTYWKISGDAERSVDCLITLIPTIEFGTDAMDILAEIGPDARAAVPALIKELESPEAPSREAAIYALASIGPEAQAALEALSKMEKDQDILIRAAAKMAIGKIEVANEATRR